MKGWESWRKVGAVEGEVRGRDGGVRGGRRSSGYGVAEEHRCLPSRHRWCAEHRILSAKDFGDTANTPSVAQTISNQLAKPACSLLDILHEFVRVPVP